MTPKKIILHVLTLVSATPAKIAKRCKHFFVIFFEQDWKTFLKILNVVYRI